jgi:hypothetical protein
MSAHEHGQGGRPLGSELERELVRALLYATVSQGSKRCRPMGALLGRLFADELERVAAELNLDSEELRDGIALNIAGVRSCDACGCTESAACEEGCSWVGDHLCSACAAAIAQAEERKGRRA